MARSDLQLPAQFTSTHNTDGLNGYPAKDFMASAGTSVRAPATGTLMNVHFIQWNLQQRVGGWTGYLVTPKGTYFLTHLGSIAKGGMSVKQGEKIGTVGAVPHGWWEDHIHEGFNPNITDAASFTAGTGGSSDSGGNTSGSGVPSDTGNGGASSDLVPGLMQQDLADPSYGGQVLTGNLIGPSGYQGPQQNRVQTWQLLSALPGASQSTQAFAQMANLDANP